MKEKVTLDSLANTLDLLVNSVKNGFDHVDEQFLGIDKRFDRVESRLERVEQGQLDIQLRLDQAAYRFELVALDGRVSRIENKIGLRGGN